MNTFLIEASIKVFIRGYYVPARLAKIYPDTSPLCYRGCNHVGDMLHIWWACPHIRRYWNKLFQIVWKVSGVSVLQDPTYALLKHRVKDTHKHIQSLILSMFMGARILIAGAWKKSMVSISATKWKILWLMSQEQIVSKLWDTVPRFEKVWEPWALDVQFPLFPGHIHL